MFPTTPRHATCISYPDARLILYRDWDGIVAEAQRESAEASLAMVTSYCPDGRPACDLLLHSPASLKIFYDLDTPVTLDQLKSGKRPDYLPQAGLKDFDLVFSYTGGAALNSFRLTSGPGRCRSMGMSIRRASSGSSPGAVPLRLVLHGDVRGRPAANARDALCRAGAATARSASS